MTTLELSRQLHEISVDIRRQVGVLLNRKGQLTHVIVGDAQRIFLPDLGRHRAGERRFRGVRLIHTHLDGQPLDRDDLTDLSLLSLDLVASIMMRPDQNDLIQIAHLLPENPKNQLWEVLEPRLVGRLVFEFDAFIRHLEAEFQKRSNARGVGQRERAIVIFPDCSNDTEELISELHELAATGGVEVVDVIVQRRHKPDPKTVIGRGRFQEVVLKSMQLGVELLIFGSDITPSQARTIATLTELRVIDRTQLILDIFAQRASSRDGKLQVELAQLRYNLPRLVGKHTALSRLAGGIGGRGPGETKLEIDRRRARDRITKLEAQTLSLSRQRTYRRTNRKRNAIPVVALVGYTNAGKSTLLNTLTCSDVYVEDQLFATLDPTSRRVRFPGEREVLITDTVGFIRDLPPDLISAFKATLEELTEANLLVHVIDGQSPQIDNQVDSVEQILSQLQLTHIPRMIALNKIDRILDPEYLTTLARRYQGIPISATTGRGIKLLVRQIESRLTGTNGRGVQRAAVPA